MTPGILLRQLQADVTLSGTSVVLLDEFHGNARSNTICCLECCGGFNWNGAGTSHRDYECDANRQSICRPTGYLLTDPAVPGQLHPVTIFYSRFGAVANSPIW